MTPLDQLALAAQSAVLDQLDRQLSAVELAIAPMGGAARARAEEDDMGRGAGPQATEARADLPTLRSSPREPSQEQIYDGGDARSDDASSTMVAAEYDRWSAPLRPARRASVGLTESMAPRPSTVQRVEAADQSEQLADTGSSRAAGERAQPAMGLPPGPLETRSDPSGTPRALGGLDPHKQDPWAQPMRLGEGSVARTDTPVLDEDRAEIDATPASSSPATDPLPRPPPDPAGARPSLQGRTPKQDLPAPLQLPATQARSAPRERAKLQRAVAQAESSTLTRAHLAPGPARPDRSSTSPGLASSAEPVAGASASESPHTGSSLAASPSLRSRLASEHAPLLPEPSLDDEFDELSRLEERMADVVERLLCEIGVEP